MEAAKLAPCCPAACGIVGLPCITGMFLRMQVVKKYNIDDPLAVAGMTISENPTVSACITHCLCHWRGNVQEINLILHKEHLTWGLASVVPDDTATTEQPKPKAEPTPEPEKPPPTDVAPDETPPPEPEQPEAEPTSEPVPAAAAE